MATFSEWLEEEKNKQEEEEKKGPSLSFSNWVNKEKAQGTLKSSVNFNEPAQTNSNTQATTPKTNITNQPSDNVWDENALRDNMAATRKEPSFTTRTIGYVGDKIYNHIIKPTGKAIEKVYEKADDYNFGEKAMNDAYATAVANSQNAWDEEALRTQRLINDRNKLLSYMTPEQKQQYNSLPENKKKDYLDSIMAELQSKSGAERAEEILAMTDKGNQVAQLIGLSFESGSSSAKSGVKGVYNLMRGAEETVAKGASEYAFSNVRPQVNGALGVAMDLANTTGNMAPSMAAGLIAAPLGFASAGTALMGISSAGRGYDEAIGQGYTPEKAAAYGIASGVAEAAMQKIVGALPGVSNAEGLVTKYLGKYSDDILSKALSNPATRKAITTVIGNAASEGTEEGVQEAVDVLLRNTILGEENKLDLNSIGYSAALGAISGGAFAAPGGINTFINGDSGTDVTTDATAETDATPEKEAHEATTAGTEMPVNEEAVVQQMEMEPEAEISDQVKQTVKAVNPKAENSQQMYREIMRKNGHSNLVDTLDKISNKFGIKLEYYADDSNSEGYHAKGVVGININNLRDTSDGVWKLMKHEMTHFIEGTEGYGRLLQSKAAQEIFSDYIAKQDFTFTTAGGESLTGAEALKEIIKERYAKNGEILSPTDLQKEVAAYLVEQSNIFTSEESIRRLAEEDPDLIERIHRWIKDTIAKLRGGAETRQLMKLEKMYERALRQAAKGEYQYNRDGLRSNTVNDGKIDEGAVSIDTKTGSVNPQFSLKTWNEFNKKKAAKDISKSLGISIEKANEYLNTIDTVAKFIADEKVLNYEAEDIYTSLKPNSEYKYTVDMSTLCVKRLIQQGTIDKIQELLGDTILTGEDYIQIRKMMQDEDYQVACGFCYVESRRKQLSEVVSDFISEHPEFKNVSIADFATVEGVKNLIKNRRDVYDAFVEHNNKRGSGKVNLVQSRTEYRNEILKLRKTTIETLNAAGGLRVQSYSDFETPHLIDMMQVVFDMATKGLKSQAYTKVVNFVEAMGLTGMKINLSTVAKGVGYDANGNLIFDDVEGMPFEEALRLRKKFPKTAGIVLIGKNDKHIELALADDRIDYVIPYHRSGWAKKEYEALGIRGYEDYTDTQNEKWKDPYKRDGKGVVLLDKDGHPKKKPIKNIYPSEYWDPNKTGDENAKIYLELCEKQGRIPKFPQFADKPGYWKLLIDFKMYDNDGNFAPQEVVQPIFDEEANRKILEEYVADPGAGPNALPVAEDIVEKFMADYKEKKQFSFKEDGNISQKSKDYIYNDVVTSFKEATGSTRLKGATEIRNQLNAFAEESVKNGKINRQDLDTVFDALWKASDTKAPMSYTTAKDQFMKSLDNFEQSINDVVRYNESKEAKVDAKTEVKNKIAEQIETIRNDKAYAKEFFKEYTQAVRAYDKAVRNEMLTPEDTKVMKQLSDGLTTWEEVEKRAGELNYNAIKRVYNAFNAKYQFEKVSGQLRSEIVGEYRQLAKDEAANSDGWKDKKAGILYSRETMERNIEDITRGANSGNRRNVDAEFINKTYFKPVHENEAKSTRLKNELVEKVKKLDLGKDKKYTVMFQNEQTGLPVQTTVSESGLVQLYGEKLIDDNILESVGANKEKIQAAVTEFRGIYNQLIDMANDTLIRNGYRPVEYRKDYFPHFTENKADSLLGEIAGYFGIDIKSDELPTDIAGLTHTFKPGKKWVGNFLERKTNVTDYDALKGFDRYLNGASDVIFHTDDIQRLRAFESELRYKYSDEGTRKRVKEIENNDYLTREQKQSLIEDIMKVNEVSHLPNLVTELRNYTDNLAGKKSISDRNWEHSMGRGVYNFAKKMEGRIAANMVALNPGSWLTNFIPITQVSGIIDSKNLVRAIWDASKSFVKSDGFADRSDFIVNRKGSDTAYKSTADKVQEALVKPFEIIDSFSADVVTRALYYDQMAKTGNEAEALEYANDMAARVMADRSKGAEPTIFNAKNPIAKLLTMFQIEVNNQYSYLFKDLPAAEREKGKAALVASLIKVFLGAYLYNELYEKVVGRRAALDPADIVISAYGDLSDPNVKKSQAIANIAANVADELPFLGSQLSGGRISVESAMPSISKTSEAASGLITGEMNTDKAVQQLGKELIKPASYLIPPVGGGQIKKAVEGISTVAQGGEFYYDNNGNKNLKYPVEDKTLGKYVKAAVFGKGALSEAQNYYESGSPSLNAKQTQNYYKAVEAGINYEQYMAANKATKGLQSDKDKDGKTVPLSLAKKKKAAIDAAVKDYGLSKKQKEILYEANEVSESVW